jgi:outer membrane beta-barrel protein
MLALLPLSVWAGTAPISAETGPPVVQNRHFLKARRFEILPALGFVPSNPFAVRYVGSLAGAYHVSESVALEARFAYAPDLGVGDVKPLLGTVVSIGAQGPGSFQQPLDKTTLEFSAALRLAPLYGKINLSGEAVVNCDVYGLAGAGVITKTNYVATSDASVVSGTPVHLEAIGNEAKPTVLLGIGSHLFLTHSVGVDLDLRDTLYLDGAPDYDPSTVTPLDGTQRLYGDLTASLGISIFIPKMALRSLRI